MTSRPTVEEFLRAKVVRAGYLDGYVGHNDHEHVAVVLLMPIDDGRRLASTMFDDIRIGVARAARSARGEGGGE